MSRNLLFIMAIKRLLIIFTYKLLVSMFVGMDSKRKRKLVQWVKLQTCILEVPSSKLAQCSKSVFLNLCETAGR